MRSLALAPYLAAPIAILAACQSPPAGETYDATSLEAEVMARLRAFEAAEKTRSPDAVIAFLDPSFSMLVDGKRFNYEQTTAQMRDSLPSLRAFDPKFDDIQILVVSPDSAVTSMVFHDVVIDAAGTTSRAWGPSTLIWRKNDGVWRIVFADSDHYPVEPETGSKTRPD